MTRFAAGAMVYVVVKELHQIDSVRDFSMALLGKWGGVKFLEKVFSMDEYSKEDIQ